MIFSFLLLIFTSQEANRYKKLLKTLQNHIQTEKDFRILLKEIQHTDTVYKDPDFYPAKPYIKEDRLYFKSSQWIYINNQYNTDVFTVISPTGIKMGAVDDEYFLSALRHISFNKSQVVKLFDRKSNSEHECALVYFYILGIRVPVLIDLLIPFKPSRIIFLSPIFTSRYNRKESYWFMLVEKAFAKACGGYSMMSGGTLENGMRYLYDCFPIHLNSILDTNNKRIEFYNLLKSLFNKNAFIDISFNGSNFYGENKGIIGSFPIFDIRECNSTKFFLIYDPKNNESNFKDLEYSNKKSAKWSTELKSSLNFDEMKSDCYWITYDELLHNFGELHCSILSENDWKIENVFGKFDKETSELNPMKDNINMIQQWSLKFTEKTTVRISFDVLGPESKYILYIVKNKGHEINTLKDLEFNMSHLNHSILDGIELDITDIDEEYTVFLSCEEKINQPSFYRIKIESPNKDFQVKSLVGNDLNEEQIPAFIRHHRAHSKESNSYSNIEKDDSRSEL